MKGWMGGGVGEEEWGRRSEGVGGGRVEEIWVGEEEGCRSGIVERRRNKGVKE